MKKKEFGSLPILENNIAGKVFSLLLFRSLTQKQLCEFIHRDSAQKRIIQGYLEKFKDAGYIEVDEERKAEMKKKIDGFKSLDKKPRLYISLLRAYPNTKFYRATLQPVVQYWNDTIRTPKNQLLESFKREKSAKKKRAMRVALDQIADAEDFNKMKDSILKVNLLNEPMNGWEDYANPEKLKGYDFNTEISKILVKFFDVRTLELMQPPSAKWRFNALEVLTLMFRTVFERMHYFNIIRKLEEAHEEDLESLKKEKEFLAKKNAKPMYSNEIMAIKRIMEELGKKVPKNCERFVSETEKNLEIYERNVSKFSQHEESSSRMLSLIHHWRQKLGERPLDEQLRHLNDMLTDERVGKLYFTLKFISDANPPSSEIAKKLLVGNLFFGSENVLWV